MDEDYEEQSDDDVDVGKDTDKVSQEIIEEVEAPTVEKAKELTQLIPDQLLLAKHKEQELYDELLPAVGEIQQLLKEPLDPEYVPEVCNEEPTLEDAEDVEQLTEMLTDWSGIKTKIRGTGSTASMSTIHPDVIKQRVKSTITKRQNIQAVQRIRAKGEASAATRKKRENKEMIRADGIWGWDN